MIAFNIIHQTFKEGRLDKERCLPPVFFTKENARQYIMDSTGYGERGRWFVYEHNHDKPLRLCHVVYYYANGAQGEYEV